MDDPEPGLLLLSKLPSFSTFYLGFTFEAFVILLIILILLMLSGLVSGAEIAFFSLSQKERADINDGDSKILKEGIKLLNKPKKLLAGILISNNFINISIILISTLLVEIVFNFSEKPIFGVLMQVVVITSMLLFFGEIMPKIFAKQKPIFFIRYMSEPLRLVLIIFKPLIELLSKTTNLIDKRLEKHKPQLSMKDLSEVIELTGEMDNAEVEEEAQKILKGIATFGDTDVKEIMKSRVDVKALEISASFEEVIQHIKEWGYSRIPIYEENLDQIKGVLYIKDLLIFLETPNLDWLAKIRPAFFVPENKKINDLLQEFRYKKIHLAIVVDEYGEIIGRGHNYNLSDSPCEENGATHKDVIHAEVSALNDATGVVSKHLLHTSTPHSIYITHMPCNDCLKAIREAGIKRENIFIVEDGIKHDKDKLRYSLIPPVLLEGVAEVMTFGAKKYKPNNWQKLDDPTRYLDALMRHLEAYRRGEEFDHETGLPHLAHLATNAGFLLWFDEQKHV